MTEDLLVDLAKSKEHLVHCVDAVPCLTPNSLPFRVLESRFLRAKEIMAAQGLYEEDYPALERYAGSPSGERLLRDLAGNAFSSTVAMAVSLACLVHCSALMDA